MVDSWLIVKANFPSLNAQSITREFVKPVVDEYEGKISTFHFFFEPYLLLRIRADKDYIAQHIQPYVVQKLSALKVVARSVRIDDGYTEEPDYEGGWKIAQKILELGSRLAVLKAESEVGNVKLSPQFNEMKFVHLLLNQWGYSRMQEAHFHLKFVGERIFQAIDDSVRRTMAT